MWIPKKSKPMACLLTSFKILTSIITDRLYEHLVTQAIMAIEQRGDKKDCYGCKDQMMINNAKPVNFRKKRKNVSRACIDYKKAFDSVLHPWITKCMNVYKVHPMITRFTESNMSKWETIMTLV